MFEASVLCFFIVSIKRFYDESPFGVFLHLLMALPGLSITRAYKELTQHDGNGHVLTRKNANTRQRRFFLFFFFFFCPNEYIGRRILKNSAPENAPFWQFERDGITAAVEFETTL